MGGGRCGTRWLALAALFALACSSSPSDPGPGPGEVSFSFYPETSTVPMIAGESREFIVTVTGTDEVTSTWSLDGTEVGTGNSYNFEGMTVGQSELSVAVTAGSKESGRDWTLVVNPDESSLPPRVTSVTAEHGNTPAVVVLEWLKDTTGTYPLQDYLVAGSYGGAIDRDNWDTADFVLQASVGAGITQRLILDEQTHDIRPGETVWFSVRSRDDRGQLSNLGNSPRITVTTAWYLDLLVQDDQGRPRPNILVDYGCSQCDRITRSDGTLRIGPFRSIDTITIDTLSPDIDGGSDPIGWFDYQTGELSEADSPYVITLLGRYDLDLTPCQVQHDNFADYLMYMTKTDLLTPLQPERMVHRWRDYPVSYFVLEGAVAGTNEQLAPHARAAFPVWDEATQREMFVAAADSASADIVVRFLPLTQPLAGVTRRVDGGTFGASIPDKLFIDITDRWGYYDDDGSWVLVRCTEVVLHEIGHALGLIDHSCLSGSNLMDNGGATNILRGLSPEEWYQAIRATESNAVRAIRYLPQGVVMGAETETGNIGYEIE